MKLLIVDDQISLHRYLDKVMNWEEIGITEVEHAYDGNEAVQMIDTYRPDLMILDVHMPSLNGIESLKQIQQKDKVPRTIILSAFDQFEYARDAIRLQVSQYLLKPVDAELLKDALRELIQESIKAVQNSLLNEFERTIYSGFIEPESLKIVREGLELLAIDRFAVLTFMDILPLEADYSSWLQEQASINIYCVTCIKDQKEQFVWVGGGEDLSNGQLQILSESIEKMMETTTSFVGISSIAQDAAILPQLIAESSQALRTPVKTRSRLQDAVWQIKGYVDSNCREDLSLQSVADRFKIDKYQLSRTFKHEFGINYWAYVTQVRMNKAAEMIVGSNWKNNYIAEQTGFLDESHFSRTFKKYYGMTPTEYRASLIHSK